MEGGREGKWVVDGSGRKWVTGVDGAKNVAVISVCAYVEIRKERERADGRRLDLEQAPPKQGDKEQSPLLI